MSNETALHTARATIAAVKEYDAQLDELYADGTASALHVKRLNARIGVGLKLAELHALCAIAEAIEGRTPAGIVRVEGNIDEETAEAIRSHWRADRS